MSKYFGFVDDKCYDFVFKKSNNDGYEFYLGEHRICSVSKGCDNKWIMILTGKLEHNIFRLVPGFASRTDAVFYAIQVHPLTRRKEYK